MASSDFIEESEASVEAKRKGLVHLGWGKYGPRKGTPPTHFTKDGKLVAYSASDKPQIQGKPYANGSNSNRGKMGKSGWTRTTPAGGMTTRRTIAPAPQRPVTPSSQPTNLDKPKKGQQSIRFDAGFDDKFGEWKPPHANRLFNECLAGGRIKKPSKLIKLLLGLGDDVKFEVGGRFEDMPHAAAYFHIATRTIHIRPEDQERLLKLSTITPEEFKLYKSDKNAYRAKYGYARSEELYNIGNAFHNIVHEGIHARDNFLRVKDGMFPTAKQIFLVEAMTETKARQVASAALYGDMLDDPNFQEDKYVPSIYLKERKALKALEDFSPGFTSKLWAMDMGQQRSFFVESTLVKFIRSKLDENIPGNHNPVKNEILGKITGLMASVGGATELWMSGIFTNTPLLDTTPANINAVLNQLIKMLRDRGIEMTP